MRRRIADCWSTRPRICIVDLGRRQGRAARDGARDRRSRERPAARHLRARRARRTARATGASASSTPSISPPPTSRVSPPLGVIAEHAALPRDRRRPLGRAAASASASRPRMRSASLLDLRRASRVRQRLVRRAADAARRHLRRGHAPDARRYAIRRLGAGRRRSRSRKRCAPIPSAAPSPRSTNRAKGVLAPGSSPIW